MNNAYCNTCHSLVRAERQQRDNAVYLVKQCPQCGPTETLISSDARRYFAKRQFEEEREAKPCALNCISCNHGKEPNLVFIDVTNRCNLVCPICINNTPSMGFTFDPPLDYFEKYFDRLQKINPPPSIQLFGGEPTVRQDLMQIIRLARKRGLTVRVVTNGLKLADEAYCEELVKSRATVLLAYDGDNPETYRILRNSKKALELKHQALENLARIPRAKVTLMSLVARGFNDHDLPRLFDLCRRYHGTVRAVYFMPLAHTWDAAKFDLEAERITMEDVEGIVADAFKDDELEFIPAGFLGNILHLLKVIRAKPLPFASAHPNCESFYLLVLGENGYVPASRYLKSPMKEVIQSLRDIDRRLAPGVDLDGGAADRSGSWLKRMKAYGLIFKAIFRHVRLKQCIRGEGIAKWWHLLAILGGVVIGRQLRGLMERHSTVNDFLQIVILPFEDRENLETERMERCPTAFAFYDPDLQQVKFVPTCAWGLYKTEAMRRITEHYSHDENETKSEMGVKS